jgi:hypothetical protein
MAKHSRFERERRAQETELTRQVAAAWFASLPADVARTFVSDVGAARARGPLPAPPPMAPGTPPRPPRPGREPKPKEERATRRRSF